MTTDGERVPRGDRSPAHSQKAFDPQQRTLFFTFRIMHPVIGGVLVHEQVYLACMTRLSMLMLVRYRKVVAGSGVQISKSRQG